MTQFPSNPPNSPPPFPPPPHGPPPGPPLLRKAGTAYRERQSFGEQAARFSLYVPPAVLVIGCITRGNADQPGVGMTIAWINLALIVAGFLLGVAALISMRIYGRQ